MESDNHDPRPSKRTNYTFDVEEQFYERVDKHVRLLKFLDNHSQSKQRWFIEAIKRKLSKNENISPHKAPKGRFLSVRIDENLGEKVEAMISSLKKVCRGYTKKQWIKEAIAEKLEEEEKEVKNLVHSKTSKNE